LNNYVDQLERDVAENPPTYSKRYYRKIVELFIMIGYSKAEAKRIVLDKKTKEKSK